MSKNYDARLVRSYRSYKVRDVCRLFKDKKLHEQTVRGWYNDGLLEGFKSGKTLYIYGAVLKSFLNERSAARKTPLEFMEFKCWTCKTVAIPRDNIVAKLERNTNGSIKASSICHTCKAQSSHTYKKKDEKEILKCFTVQQNALGALCDSVCSNRNTNIETSHETALCEPVETKPPDTREENTTAPKETNIEPTQLRLF